MKVSQPYLSNTHCRSLRYAVSPSFLSRGLATVVKAQTACNRQDPLYQYFSVLTRTLQGLYGPPLTLITPMDDVQRIDEGVVVSKQLELGHIPNGGDGACGGRNGGVARRRLQVVRAAATSSVTKVILTGARSAAMLDGSVDVSSVSGSETSGDVMTASSPTGVTAGAVLGCTAPTAPAPSLRPQIRPIAGCRLP
jgi:hypothetical protein